MRSGWGREGGGQSLSHRGVKWRNAVVFFCLVGHRLPLLCCSRLLGWWWWLWRVDRRPLYGRNVWRDGCRPAWLRGGRAVGRGEDEGRIEAPSWRRGKFVLTTTTARTAGGGDRRRRTPASGLAAAQVCVYGGQGRPPASHPHRRTRVAPAGPPRLLAAPPPRPAARLAPGHDPQVPQPDHPPTDPCPRSRVPCRPLGARERRSAQVGPQPGEGVDHRVVPAPHPVNRVRLGRIVPRRHNTAGAAHAARPLARLLLRHPPIGATHLQQRRRRRRWRQRRQRRRRRRRRRRPRRWQRRRRCWR